MEMPLEQEPPDGSTGEGSSNELIKLVRKLRWVGMEEEADRLLKKLKRGHAATAESVLATPRETD